MMRKMLTLAVLAALPAGVFVGCADTQNNRYGLEGDGYQERPVPDANVAVPWGTGPYQGRYNSSPSMQVDPQPVTRDEDDLDFTAPEPRDPYPRGTRSDDLNPTDTINR